MDSDQKIWLVEVLNFGSRLMHLQASAPQRLNKMGIDLQTYRTFGQSLQQLASAAAKIDGRTPHVSEDMTQVESLDKSTKRIAAAPQLLLGILQVKFFDRHTGAGIHFK